MKVVLYGIKNCDTVKKARYWLEAHKIEYTFHDFRADGLNEDVLKDFLKHVDWEILLNKRGTTWRKLPDKQKNEIDSQKALELMNENLMLIKRPVLAHGKNFFVGFADIDYEKIFISN